MTRTLASLADEERRLGELVCSLVDDSVLNPALPSTRRPKYRAAYPVHRPTQERDARKALPVDSPLCVTCGERIPVLREGECCPVCFGDPR